MWMRFEQTPSGGLMVGKTRPPPAPDALYMLRLNTSDQELLPVKDNLV